MAGAGYKLFNTGDVLTAAQVNTYLMEQTVMVFADAAARTAALSGVVSEGMISYLKDTNAVEVYNGSAWVASDDPNAIQNTIVDAKGDLITATAADTPARLAVGNNGETLVADSSASTGLRWQGSYEAGKNKIINGDFRINQRNFTTTNSVSVYTFDRWITESDTSNNTWSAQTFTPGAAPVSGYEGVNFLRMQAASQSASNNYCLIDQRIEDVRTLANQTVTLSFWAKASSGTPKVGTSFVQNFGSGGSSFIVVKSGDVTISTSWARYSVTIAMPSISGKTVGSGSYIRTLLWASGGSNFNQYTDIGLQNTVIDIWGVQLEAGNVATAFQTATGTLAGELAACQRYYREIKGQFGYVCIGVPVNTTDTVFALPMPCPMRTTPTLTVSANNDFYLIGAASTAVTSFVPRQTGGSPSDSNNAAIFAFYTTVASGLTAGSARMLYIEGANGSLKLSAEL